MEKIRVFVLILSDKASAGLREDRTGPALERYLSTAEKDGTRLFSCGEKDILPDDPEKISEKLKELADCGRYDLILTSGGTGLSPRDFTPEASLAVADREVPGLAEMMRRASAEITPLAALSRGAAVIRKKSLIINLPGSPKAARGNLEAIAEILPHAVEVLRGEAYECAKGRKS